MKHLWLDLESTVITPVLEGWFRTEVINVAKVKAFIEEFQPDQVHIFSFAIWDQEQLERFTEGTRPMLEEALGVTFDRCPTVDGDILPACCEVMKISMSTLLFSDLVDFWGKHEAFRLYLRGVFGRSASASTHVLLDDVVFNEEFHWPDMKITGRILNIDTM